jgi:hypothetical protein
MKCSCAVLRRLGGVVLWSLGVVSRRIIRSRVVLRRLGGVVLRSIGEVLDPLVV